MKKYTIKRHIFQIQTITIRYKEYIISLILFFCIYILYVYYEFVYSSYIT